MMVYQIAELINAIYRLVLGPQPAHFPTTLVFLKKKKKVLVDQR